MKRNFFFPLSLFLSDWYNVSNVVEDEVLAWMQARR